MIVNYLIKVELNTDDTSYEEIIESLYDLGVFDVDLLETYKD